MESSCCGSIKTHETHPRCGFLSGDNKKLTITRRESLSRPARREGTLTQTHTVTCNYNFPGALYCPTEVKTKPIVGS